ncbi:MAG: hypothetical protein DHS20C08_22420 [Rhodomicrobium sp.]|nr:MAG: hypothetical protein DHS20C08_22420 [Rhodomicrobium sp.]
MTDANTSDLTFTIIRHKTDLLASEKGWNELYDESGKNSQIFLTFNWLWHWLDAHQSPSENLIILTASQAGKLVLIAPLTSEKRYGLNIVTWAGSPVSQYGDILIKEHIENHNWLKEAFKFLVDEIRPDIFHLRKVRFDAAITPLLENYTATILDETAAPYIEILGAQNFTEFNKRYSQRSRKSKRRHRRKLEEHGALSFSLIKEGPEAEAAAMKAITQKRAWLKEMKIISPAFNTDLIDRFFKKAAASTERPAGIRVSELKVDGKTVATEIGVQVKDYYGAHLGTYDPDYTSHSPGSLQIQDTIAALIEDGVEVVDLFAPGDTYKYEWSKQTIPVFDFAYSISLKGKLYETLYLKRLRPALKMLAARLSRK